MWLDDCTPSCAQGKFYPHAATAHASDPQAGYFSRLTVQYTYEGKERVTALEVIKEGSGYGYRTIGSP